MDLGEPIMDMKNNDHNLVPGQGKPLNLDKLRKLAAGQSLATGQPSMETAPALKPRRFKRAGRAWAGVLALGIILASAGAMVFLETGGILEMLVRSSAQPAMPDQGMTQADQEKYWALASFEPTRFPSLMGVPPSDFGREEENARKLQRLLSDREHPGLH